MRPRIINVLDIRGARLIRLDHNRRRHVHTYHPAQFGRRYNMPHPAGRPIANSAIVTHPNYHLGPDAVRSCWPGGRWDIERRIACGLVDAQATSRHIEIAPDRIGYRQGAIEHDEIGIKLRVVDVEICVKSRVDYDIPGGHRFVETR